MMVGIDRLELHYDILGDGEPLLWLHGGMGHGADWQHIFETPPRGYRIVAPDLRGHGRSSGESSTYSFRRSALDMLALLDHLRIDSVKTIGLSGGGITALHLATIQPARVAAMIAISAPAAFPAQARAVQRGFSEGMLGEAELARMRQRHSRPGQLEALFAQIRAMADGDDPSFTREQLASISAETLIVFGDRDHLYPVSIACDLHAAIPRSYLWVVPNGGHAPVFGDAASQFVRTALSFFNGEWRQP